MVHDRRIGQIKYLDEMGFNLSESAFRSCLKAHGIISS